MTRTLLFLVLILVVGAGGAWLADHPGSVQIDWEGWRIETSLAFLALAAGALLLGGILIRAVWGWLRAELPFVGANRHLARQRRGLVAMNDAVIALAAGNPRAARRLSDRARRLLPPQPLTHVLAAQVARLSGDEAGAEAEFKALLADPSAAFIGLRGLVTAALREGRTHEALRLARQAAEEQPDSPWATHTLFGLEARAGDWAAAEATLERGRKAGAFGMVQVRRHRAALLFLRVREFGETDLVDSLEGPEALLKRSLRLRPGFPPAVGLLVKLQLAGGHASRATATLLRAWTKFPHPDTLCVFMDLDPVERPTERLKRLQRLARKNPDHLESRLALADGALRAGHLEDARDRLGDLRLEDPVARVFQTLIRLERAAMAEGDEDEPDGKGTVGFAETHELDALRAPDYRWVCDQCGYADTDWTAHCISCHAFDSGNWIKTDPGRRAVGQGSGQDGSDRGQHKIVALLPDALAEMIPPPPDVEPPDADTPD